MPLQSWLPVPVPFVFASLLCMTALCVFTEQPWCPSRGQYKSARQSCVFVTLCRVCATLHPSWFCALTLWPALRLTTDALLSVVAWHGPKLSVTPLGLSAALHLPSPGVASCSTASPQCEPAIKSLFPVQDGGSLDVPSHNDPVSVVEPDSHSTSRLVGAPGSCADPTCILFPPHNCTVLPACVPVWQRLVPLSVVLFSSIFPRPPSERLLSAFLASSCICCWWSTFYSCRLQP